MTPDEVKGKVRAALKPPELPDSFNAKSLTPEDITDERLLEACKAAARIADRYGETYLPVFKALHTELENRRKDKDYMALARAFSEPAPDA